MFNDLKSLVESILSIIVKSEALEKCKKAKQLINLSLNDKPDLPMEILTADMEKFKNQCEQMKKTIIMLKKMLVNVLKMPIKPRIWTMLRRE